MQFVHRSDLSYTYLLKSAVMFLLRVGFICVSPARDLAILTPLIGDSSELGVEALIGKSGFVFSGG